ncbi:hypothetical protein OGAPHI_004688 [Ogataea philodendri]|uniref:Uncharacterized protein n=1 Tax=Ogataea philodendri TaxID=1378263 RepID=A0A9P8P3F0_9ASCO|nr:uncharacterized protein OGAPHI_004688 [Ogataea philodendri]KAH3663974.1 hypothetical protein OGAPHI_004688 [Ogataea philodendri]
MNTCNSVRGAPWKVVDVGDVLEVGVSGGGIANVLDKLSWQVGGPDRSSDCLSNTGTNRAVQRENRNGGGHVLVGNTGLGSDLGSHNNNRVTNRNDNVTGNYDSKRWSILHLGGLNHQSKSDQSHNSTSHLENLVTVSPSEEQTPDNTKGTQTHGLGVAQPHVTTHLVQEINENTADESSVDEHTLWQQWVRSKPDVINNVGDEQNTTNNFHGNHGRVVPSSVGVGVKGTWEQHQGESETDEEEPESVDLNQSSLDLTKTDLWSSNKFLAISVDTVVDPENQGNSWQQSCWGDDCKHTVTPSPVGSDNVLDNITGNPGSTEVRSGKQTKDGRNGWGACGDNETNHVQQKNDHVGNSSGSQVGQFSDERLTNGTNDGGCNTQGGQHGVTVELRGSIRLVVVGGGTIQRVGPRTQVDGENKNCQVFPSHGSFHVLNSSHTPWEPFFNSMVIDQFGARAVFQFLTHLFLDITF